jgi:hypothetical protein
MGLPIRGKLALIATSTSPLPTSGNSRRVGCGIRHLSLANESDTPFNLWHEGLKPVPCLTATIAPRPPSTHHTQEGVKAYTAGVEANYGDADP